MVILSMRKAPTGNALGLDPAQDRLELCVADTEAVMLLRQRAISLVEVERQSVVHIDGRARADGPLLRPWHTEQACQTSGAGHPISSGNDQVIELSWHGDSPLPRFIGRIPSTPSDPHQDWPA